MTTVLYSIAHSDPKRPSGAVTEGGISENMVATEALSGLRMRLETRAIKCECFSGPLSVSVRRMRKTITTLRKLGERHVAIELHFNSTSTVPCRVCGQPKHKGMQCKSCGAKPTRPWRIGHTAMVSRWAPSSIELAGCILARLSAVMPWSRERKPILMPDARYGPKVWPEAMYPPAVLVEAGFGCDDIFASYIQDQAGRVVLGMALADGVIDFLGKTSGIPIENWGAVEAKHGLAKVPKS